MKYFFWFFYFSAYINRIFEKFCIWKNKHYIYSLIILNYNFKTFYRIRTSVYKMKGCSSSVCFRVFFKFSMILISKSFCYFSCFKHNLLMRLEVRAGRHSNDIHSLCSFHQAADEPAYLTVGTDVSAKYRGAFCEAKIKTVKRLVKVKVIFVFMQ